MKVHYNSNNDDDIDYTDDDDDFNSHYKECKNGNDESYDSNDYDIK